MDKARVIISKSFRRELEYHHLSERTLAEAAFMPEHFIEIFPWLPEGPIFPLSSTATRRPRQKPDDKNPKAYRLQVRTVENAGTPAQKCRVLLFIQVNANGAYEPGFLGLLFDSDFPVTETPDPLYALLTFAKAFGSPLKHLGTDAKYLFAASAPIGFVSSNRAHAWLPNHRSVIVHARATRHTREKNAEGEREAYEERSTIVFAINLDLRKYRTYLAKHGIESRRAAAAAWLPDRHAGDRRRDTRRSAPR